MTAYVLYDGEWPVGVFESFEEIAERLGVKVSSVRWWSSPTAKRKKGKRRIVEKVEI